MKCLYSNNNVALVWHVRNMLEQQGVAVLVKNDRLYSIAGEMPITECMAEVWVKSPLQYEFAQQLIAEMESGSETIAAPWDCPDCGESIEGNFDICWNCQNGTVKDYELIV